MKIGIDGYEANQAVRVGIGRYAFELLHALSQLTNNDEFVIFIPNKKSTDLPPETKSWRYEVVKSQKGWTYWDLPQVLKSVSLDIFFSPTHYVPLFCPMPKAFSIMDLSYIRFPELFRVKDQLQLRFGTWYSARSAQKIFTISHFSKNEIVSHYHIAEEKIVVTYPGFDSKLFHPYETKQIQGMLGKYKIGKDYIVSIGTLQPRKNITRLLEAFESMKNRKEKLLIIGKKGWLYEEILSKIRELERAGNVRYLDFVPDQDLSMLLAGARCFMLPSLYEGFGIPAVEAMACGVPVIVSNVSSLPEIVGDAGIAVDPYSVASIAGGISQALSLTATQRNRIIQKGFVQSRQFSWQTCAQLTLQGLQKMKL